MLNSFNNRNNQLEFLDLLNIMSFMIGLMNLDQNMTQNDKQELQKDLGNQTSKLLNELHAHLDNQDKKINLIMKKLGLEVKENDN